MNHSMNWVVLAYGSDDHEVIKDSDPFVVDDRGWLFDGINDYASLEGLVLNTSYTYSFWVKPHGDGTLVTSASKNGSGFYAFGVSGFRTRYEDSFNGIVWNAGAGLVENFVWQNLALAADWTGVQTDLKVYKNGYFVDGMTTRLVTIDRPDFDHHHIVGANERDGALFDFYSGFIYSLRVSNRGVENFNDVVYEGIDCGVECDFCPGSGKCLGQCSSNQFWNGQKCVRCPSWCNLGCQSDGTC
jgi:hypothetical protein